MAAGIAQVRAESILHFQQDTRAAAPAISVPGAIACLVRGLRARPSLPGFGRRYAPGGNGLWPL
ncbi:hypothetical protein ACLFKU_39220 [Paraburkholderia sp. EG304]